MKGWGPLFDPVQAVPSFKNYFTREKLPEVPMRRREVTAEPVVEPKKDNYFSKSNLQFIGSGCVLFDCVLGGGWPLGRISNLVGDKSTGKTLCAIEAAANFIRKWPDGHIWYREAEAAFDETYAETLGLPVDKVDFGEDGIDTQWETIEDIYEDLQACCALAIKSGQPGLYIVDSLDALSSRAELARNIDEGTYGMEKQKQLGQLFRRLTRDIKQANVAVIIVSQVREKIGMAFGDKVRRSGGKALDFYASIVVYLSHLKRLKRTIGGISRPTGIIVRVKCEKNKISMPFRECEFSLRFGYGIDEMAASIAWLDQARKAKPLLDGVASDKYLAETESLEGSDYRKRCATVRKAVRVAWREVEESFTPVRRKYT